jgi:aminomethyltransferase
MLCGMTNDVVAAPSPPPSPLADLHHRLGAAFVELENGAPVAAVYGSVAEELHTLRTGCALVDSSWQGRLVVTGADRHRFVNAYVTCDVKGLAADSGAYGFFTTPKGGILSDVTVLALEDRLWLRVAPGADASLGDHLRRYILADRVAVQPLADVALLTLAGPRAREVLAGTAEALAAAWRHVHATVAGAEALVERTGRLGVEAYTLWAPAGEAERLAERLLENPLVRPAGFEALETLRAEEGIPRCGRDYKVDNFPQETGVEEAVSYTKGCYLGQEIVARIHYRGGVQKTLRGLLFDAEVAPGTPVLHDGREAGKATTVVYSPTLKRWIGLGIVHKRAAEPGTRVELAAGGSAEVAELPLVRNDRK